MGQGWTPMWVILARRLTPVFMKKPVGGGKTPSTGPEKCWLPECASMRTRPERVEPEVWFRIVHLAQDNHSGAPVAAYREQTVEIALGPKGAFENGNIGALRLRAPPGQGVSEVRPSRGNPKPAKVTEAPPSRRTPPKNHRMEGPPGIQKDGQSGCDRPSGGNHSRPGDSGHGHATAGSGYPGKDPYLTPLPPPPPRDRADAPTHWGNRGSSRPTSGI